MFYLDSYTLMSEFISVEKNTGSRSTGRFVKSGAALVVLLFLIWSAGSAGFASLLSAYAARSGQVEAANKAARLSPRDAQPHLVRGGVLQAKGDLPAALASYSRAVSVHPDDYVLWLTLAHARELNGDTEGAIAAATQAVGLAPHYAKPRWHLGNLLIRAGRVESGFGELHLAGASNPGLLPSLVDLAWRLSGGNVQVVMQAIKPQGPAAYTALADYFKKRGLTAEAIAMFRSAGDAAQQERRGYLSELLTVKHFKDAHALWSIAHHRDSNSSSELMFSPGFEEESDLDEPGFGWRGSENAENVHLSLDAAEPNEGHYSLQVLFNGASDPGQPIVAQLVSIPPGTRYQLRFAARTQEIVSGGLPEVTIVDSGSGALLGESGALPQPSSGWREYTIGFTTLENSEAVQIRLERGPCGSPCPIFGRLWLDKFSLQKTSDK